MLQKNTYSLSRKLELSCLRALSFIFILALILFISITNAYSAQVTLEWDPNTEPDFAGHKIYSGPSSRNYDSVNDVGNQTSYTIQNLVEGQTYYIAVTAYNTFNTESDYSAEVVYTVPILGGGCSISTSQETFNEYQPITVNWSGGPGNASDWIGVSAAGSASTSYIHYAYIGGASGNTTFGSGLPDGNYEVRLYEDNTYTISCSDTFSVGGGGCAGFDELFNSGNAANWARDSGTWNVVAGRWYSTKGVRNKSSTSTYNDTYSDFDYSAKLRRSRFGRNWPSRLFVRASEAVSYGRPTNAYMFQYSNSGKYSVYKIAGGVDTALQPWASSSAIKRGNAWNELRVVASGPNFWFYINGTLVWSGSDSSYSSGRVGLGFYHSSSASDRLWVDWAFTTDSILSP